jgi:hypothetical protein
MYISWSVGSATTPGSAPAPQVRWGTTDAYGSTQAASGTTVPTPSGYTLNAADTDDTAYLSTLLQGLDPNTTYHYSVSNDGINWFADTTFTTGQTGVVNFRWVGTGDEATNGSSSLPVADVIAAYKPAFTIVAGDLSYASGGVVLPAGGGSQPSYSPATWDSYFQIFGLNAAQSIPWLVGVGNHEMEPLTEHGYAGFLTRFPRPYDLTSGSPVVSTFTYGNVAFIQLDGNDLSAEMSANNGYTAGTQTAWLTRKLAAYRAAGSGIDFIVVSFHNCMFCTNQGHGSDGGIRTIWEPIFDAYQVDLVLNGHNHAYERTYPIKAGAPTAVVASGATAYPATQGTTYICAGNGGQSLYNGWYGSTGAGAAGSGTPQVYEWSGGDSATGGSGSAENVNDPVTGYSAFRQSSFGFIVVDVTAPTTQGGTTTMRIQSVSSTSTVIDSVTLSRTSTVSLGTGANTVAVANPGAETSTVGVATSVAVKATDSAPGQALTYSATGLPSGLAINAASGLISGTPSEAGTSTVTVAATDSTGATGSASFTWTVNPVTVPRITSVSPTKAAAGHVVTVTGTGFGATRGAGYITFTDVPDIWGAPTDLAVLTIDSWGDNTITFTVPTPQHNGAWKVKAGTTATFTVTNAAGQTSNTASLAIKS